MNTNPSPFSLTEEVTCPSTSREGQIGADRTERMALVGKSGGLIGEGGDW